jgi:predicted O-methyltransferase YrrM
MEQRIWSEVESYFDSLFVDQDPDIDAAVAASDASGLPAIQVSSDLGRLLFMLTRIQGARRILEVGTLGGVSAIWMASALPPLGRLVTLELDARHADVARSNLDAAGYGDRVEIRVGDAAESLRQLRAERGEPFDLIFLDADKQGYPTYLELALELTRPGTILVADNVVRGGRVLEAESEDASVRGVRAFLEQAAADPRLEGTAIQTVGAKSYDGVAVFRVR